jgi:alkylation response protein AidB-like acyl-CoA dehydrogenase
MLDQTSQWYKLQYPDCFVNEEQRMIQRLFADFVDKEIMPVRDKIDDDVTHDEIITPILKKLQVDLGCQADMIPKDYGGNENFGMVSAALRGEQLARGDWGITLHTACTNWGLTPATAAYLFPSSPVAKAWGKAVLDAFAAKFVGNELRVACFNMAESESACDIENHTNEARLVHTRAELRGDEWVINGAKHWATNSGIADLNLVVCNMDPKSGIDGFALIYVPEPWHGLSHGKFEIKCGVQADRNTSTYFDDVRVPRGWGIQGPEAWNMFLNQLVSAVALQSTSSVGMLQGAFDVLLEYTGQRVVGGKPIRQHLSTAMFLGEMASVISVARAAVLELNHEFDHREIYGSRITDSALAKARTVQTWIARTAPELILRGMEFMGSYGYVRENHYEKYYRDAAALKLVLGGVQLGYFSVCRQFYDLDFSSFGPGRLQAPVGSKQG